MCEKYDQGGRVAVMGETNGYKRYSNGTQEDVEDNADVVQMKVA